MKRSLLIVFINLFSLLLFSQNLPNSRKVDWSKAGLNYIPEIEKTYNVLDYGADSTGVIPVDSIITLLMDSTSSKMGCIYFPAGTYLVSRPIILQDSLVLKGAGSDSTFLNFDFNNLTNHGFTISRSQSTSFVKVLHGFEKGSTTLVIDTVVGIVNGDHVEIQQENGAWDTSPASYAEDVVGQIMKVTGINANEISFDTPLRIDYDTSLNLGIRKVNLIQDVGIECMKISRIDTPSNPGAYNINFNFASNCWVKGIESNRSMGSHVMIANSIDISVTGSYFHHSYIYDGSGTRGYGVTIRKHAGNCLVENNSFQFLRHAMMVKEGANGNVFAYNYSIEPNRSEPISDFSGDISIHGHYSFANLFEGNIVQNIIVDHYWGPSGPYNTFLRNRAELYGLLVLADPNPTNYLNFLGNEVTSNQPLMGLYQLDGSNHFEYGNNIKGTITPAGTDMLQDSSYYLSGKPRFWESSIPWPSIGYPNPLNSASIPAKERFLNNSLKTVCTLPSVDSTVDSTNTVIDYIDNKSINSIEVYPNPFHDSFSLFFDIDEAAKSQIQLFDITGKLIEELEIMVKPNQTINLKPKNALSGVYLLKVKTQQQVFERQLVKH